MSFIASRRRAPGSRDGRGRRWLGGRRREALTPLIFVGPALAVLVLVHVVPIVISLILSFTNYDLINQPQFTGLQNYQSVLSNAEFWQSLARTGYFALGQVPLGTLLALLAALLLHQRLVGSAAWRTIVYLPQASSYVIVAIVWSFLFNSSVGPIDTWLRALHLPPVYWLTDVRMAMPSIIIMSLWRNLGYYMVVYLAAMQAIPEELYEASQVDGASSLARFRHITMPLLTPITGFILITWFLGALQMFTQAYVMTNGGPVDVTTSIVFLIYRAAFEFLQFGQASAMAIVFFLIVAALTLIARWLMVRREVI